MSDASELNQHIPTGARMWNHWLGGKDNFQADRDAADAVVAMYPEMRLVALESRRFLARAVDFVGREAGITQYLDVGTGLPTENNTHELAQRIDPASKIVYVDNDPLVLIHARALLASSPKGECRYIDSDVRDVDGILSGARETLDLDRPVALMMLGILGYIRDYDEAKDILNRLLAALAPGSYLVLNDGDTTDQRRVIAAEKHDEEYGDQEGAAQYTARSPEEIAGFFDGLELVEPGVVSTPHWRPIEQSLPSIGEPNPVPLAVRCGVARKR